MKNKRGPELLLIKAMVSIGLFVLVFNYLFESIYLGGVSLSTNIYAKLFGFALIYLGALFKFRISDKKILKKGLNFIKKSQDHIAIVVLIFFSSSFIGYIYADKLLFIAPIIQDLIEQTRNLGHLELTSFIFMNNSLASVYSIVIGLWFGFFPIFSSFSNGIILGFVSSLVIAEAGILTLWRLLPHGIFELPAIFISFGIGLKVGIETVKEIFRHFSKNSKIIAYLITLSMIVIPFLVVIIPFTDKKLTKSFKTRFKSMMLALITAIIPLLIVAALIEGFLIAFL
jgi:stage II sporulation protein M